MRYAIDLIDRFQINIRLSTRNLQTFFVRHTYIYRKQRSKLIIY